MTEFTQDLSLAQAHSLIDSYAFDLGGEDAQQLLQRWSDTYHASWIRMATIEALYLGRYKAISIEQILKVWLRIGTPNPHFTYEFERLICRKLPKHLNDLSNLVSEAETTAMVDADEAQTAESKSIDAAIAPQTQQVTFSEGEQTNTAQTWENSAVKPSSGKINLIPALGFAYTPNWSELNTENKAIHQFIPLPDVSSFFSKLKRFGAEQLERQ